MFNFKLDVSGNELINLIVNETLYLQDICGG